MPSFEQVTSADLHATPPAVPTSEDVRAKFHQLLDLGPDQYQRLSGQACARRGGTEHLRSGGMAYTTSGPDGTGRLAWPVRVCRHHAKTGGTQ